jgi:thiamine biosynthesis lipoprotein
MMSIKHISAIFGIFFIFTFLMSCAEAEPVSVRRTEFALGTIISVRIDGMDEAEAASALDKAFARLFEIEAVACPKKPGSELYSVNKNNNGGEIIISSELSYLLEAGYLFTEMTDSAFSIKLGALINLWAIGTENARVPNADEIQKALADDSQIDLGAIAKGYIGDEMRRVLIENNVTNAVIDLGGDVIAIGSKLIGLNNPKNPGQVCASVRVYNQSVMTSGDYERYFIYEGRRYHHIFDQTTGYPAENGVISATVISGSAMLADVLSTAFFVMGVERAIEFAAEMPEISYILIDTDMNFYYSESLEIEIIK